jgi:glycerol-3-phosphate acyltransferase PlsY
MGLEILLVLFGAYLVGSIPFGYILVKILTGEDIRNIQSGRTGTTNTLRAVGFGPALMTFFFDIAKGAVSVYLAKGLPAFGNPWLLILIPLFVIIGNNYSIFMFRKDQQGRLLYGGGAGGAACLGGAIGFWWPSGLIIISIGVLIYYFVGYASVGTMWIALGAAIIFAYRGLMFGSPWAYVIYSLAAEGLLLISLRPNIIRLLNGTERLIGFRARKLKNESNYSS